MNALKHCHPCKASKTTSMGSFHKSHPNNPSLHDELVPFKILPNPASSSAFPTFS
jgi:hypothetical protein